MAEQCRTRPADLLFTNWATGKTAAFVTSPLNTLSRSKVSPAVAKLNSYQHTNKAQKKAPAHTDTCLYLYTHQVSKAQRPDKQCTQKTVLDSSTVLGLQQMELINTSIQGIQAIDLAYVKGGLVPMQSFTHSYPDGSGSVCRICCPSH